MKFRVTEKIIKDGKVIRERRYEADHVADTQRQMENWRKEFAAKRLQATIDGRGIEFVGVEQEFEILPVEEG